MNVILVMVILILSFGMTFEIFFLYFLLVELKKTVASIVIKK